MFCMQGGTRGPMSERRELYRSPNGDSWFLGREPGDGRAFIIHQPNAPSGGRLSHIDLGEFLRSGDGPEQRGTPAPDRNPGRGSPFCINAPRREATAVVIGAGRQWLTASMAPVATLTRNASLHVDTRQIGTPRKRVS